jgi:hypothetical protein
MRVLAAEEFGCAPALRQCQFVLSVRDGSCNRFLNSEKVVKVGGCIFGEKQAQTVLLADG